jgi:anti-anti-sigma factor
VTPLADLTLEVRDGPVVAAIRGDIDLSNVRDISSRIIDATPNSATGLVVDLSNVTYLDSAGLNCLFDFSERLQTRRQRFCIIVPDKSLISRIITFSNIGHVASVVHRLDDALAVMSRSAVADQSTD